jgi:hypothetical protein
MRRIWEAFNTVISVESKQKSALWVATGAIFANVFVSLVTRDQGCYPDTNLGY